MRDGFEEAAQEPGRTRLRYPFELEWMEGSMLCHALRLRAAPLDG